MKINIFDVILFTIWLFKIIIIIIINVSEYAWPMFGSLAIMGMFGGGT